MNKFLTEKEQLQNIFIEVDTLSGVNYFIGINARLKSVKCQYPIHEKCVYD